MEQRNLHLQQKYQTIREKEVRYATEHIEDADYVIVAFGSAARVAEKSIEVARQQGIKVGLFRPITYGLSQRSSFMNLHSAVKAYL